MIEFTSLLCQHMLAKLEHVFDQNINSTGKDKQKTSSRIHNKNTENNDI